MTTMLATWDGPGKVAIEAAAVARAMGKTPLDCLEAGLAAAEDDPNLIAIGRGSLPNADGELELDAAVMEGTNLRCGAVCAMRGILPAISVARLVMERTPHVMLAGDQAQRFAIQHGFRPQNLMTAESISRYEQYLRSPERAKDYVHTVQDGHDTVTMLAVEDGKTIAASSTSGLGFKLPGRVGDSPIVGAGIYADDEVGSAGATGWGEQLWKACASFRTVEAMRRGMTAQEACDDTARYMARRIPESREMACVVLALSKDGDYGAATTAGRFDLWIWQDGRLDSRAYLPLEA